MELIDDLVLGSFIYVIIVTIFFRDLLRTLLRPKSTDRLTWRICAGILAVYGVILILGCVASYQHRL